MACPHAAIRSNVYPESALAGAPATFKSTNYKGQDFKGQKFTIQVAPEDCTGCRLCVSVCPAKDKSNPKHKAINMAEQAPLRMPERENYTFFLNLPRPDRASLKIDLKGSQFMEPLFEYSGACAGCGETPYIKLLTQLFGDRLLIGNATGCTSIYGGNLPTTPYCKDRNGRGPAWANSLFEDNAEFGLGYRMALDKHTQIAHELVKKLAGSIGDNLVKELLEADQSTEAAIATQRERVGALKQKLSTVDSFDARRLLLLADYLVSKSVWIVGGDGWAYDIGYGGLDHVMAMGRNVNILVLDTEVYSNTGGQASKSTPMGAAAKFAASGKATFKKDLGMIAMTYGNVYVAKVAMGARDAQTAKAFQEAASYPGTSLIIAYSHCIAHGYDLSHGLEQQKLAVDAGHWPLFRYDPRRVAAGQIGLQLDSAAPKIELTKYTLNETRYRMVQRANPERFADLMGQAQKHVSASFAYYEQLSKLPVENPAAPVSDSGKPASGN
jgi:pyruvate-ferredoxin/flavodoxin oxidoreductase